MNLASSRLIKLAEGAAPDLGGFCMLRHGSDDCVNGKWTYKIWKEYSHARNATDLLMIVVDPTGSGSQSASIYQHGQAGYHEPLRSAIDGCAQAANDDQIRFEGAGVTIYVPFGHGQGIYESILQAIKAGAPDSIPLYRQTEEEK